MCRLMSAGAPPSEAIAKLEAWMEQQLRECGWAAHIVPNSDESPTGFNAHTHGLLESFGHPDLQVVYRFDPSTIGLLFNEVVERIKAGLVLTDGYQGEIVPGVSFVVITARESGRDVLRLVFPDDQGSLDRATMTQPQVQQFYPQKHATN